MTDPIADMLTRIRNAQAARKGVVEISSSKIKKQLAEILSHEGYLGKVEEDSLKLPKLVLELKYNGREPVIQSLARISKPGHRVYCSAENLPTILNDYGIAIISTSQGIMTNKEAKKAKVGGEIICSVY